jgi:DNA-binding response OmpR family regulator
MTKETEKFTNTEGAILAILQAGKPDAVSRNELVKVCYEPKDGKKRTGPVFATSNIVDVHIKNICLKIGREKIETIRGFGYRFV